MSKLNLEKIEHYYSLFTFYHLLLTPKQQQYFQEHFLENLSLQEVADNFKVSRSAISDSLKKTLKLLDDYEQKLLLYQKYQARKKIYDRHLEYNFVIKLQEIDKI